LYQPGPVYTPVIGPFQYFDLYDIHIIVRVFK